MLMNVKGPAGAEIERLTMLHRNITGERAKSSRSKKKISIHAEAQSRGGFVWGEDVASFRRSRFLIAPELSLGRSEGLSPSASPRLRVNNTHPFSGGIGFRVFKSNPSPLDSTCTRTSCMERAHSARASARLQ